MKIKYNTKWNVLITYFILFFFIYIYIYISQNVHHSLLKYSGPYTTLACYVTVMYSYKCTIFAILQCTKFLLSL